MVGEVSPETLNLPKWIKIDKQEYINKPGHYWELSEEIFNRIDDSNRQNYVDFMKTNPHIAKRKCVNTKA